MKRQFKTTSGLLAASLILAPLLAYAQVATPKASEISGKARSVRFAKGNSVSASQGKRTAAFVPIDFGAITKADDLNGKVVGQLQTNVPKNVTGLSPGTYNLYLLNSGGSWHAYYQSKGTVTEASRVEISQDQKPTGVDSKAELSPQDWHVCVYDHWICVYR